VSTNNVDWASEVQTAVLAMKEEGQKAYTFMKQEAPEVAAEYVAWKRVDSAVEVAAEMACACILAWAASWIFKKSIHDEFERAIVRTGGFFAAIAGFLFFIEATSDIPKAVKPWVSPRITIIEGIKEVVR